MHAENVYVSITGLRLKGRRHLLRFWWHTLRSMVQARRAPGNLRTEMRMVGCVHHTLSVWASEQAMRAFLVAGAHRDAMKVFRAIGNGRTLGFVTDRPPDWDDGLRRWHSEAKDV